MKRDRLLWVDDEIDFLRPHILFLQGKGYDVTTVTNGVDALEKCRTSAFDLVLLDEHMPGLTGLETLEKLKQTCPDLPVVMVTKSEEENIMDMAIGRQIADYLIKPVNPNQILLSLKKVLHRQDIVSASAANDYREDFAKIDRLIADTQTARQWQELYRRLVRWELELAQHDGPMGEMAMQQKGEANARFARFVGENYARWMASEGKDPEQPLLSHRLMEHTVFPLLKRGERVFFCVIDNFRYDQWRVIAPELAPLFSIDEQLYFSLLPTATQYARNAIFAGMTPDEIAGRFPHLWVDEDSPEGKNLNELPLIEQQLAARCPGYRCSYHKLNDARGVEQLTADLPRLQACPLTVAVLNFIDMLSHSRTENKLLRELASTEAAYRSITLSWFRHSPLTALFRALARAGWTVVLTTDHGSIRVKEPVRVQSNAGEANSNLRYKVSKNISYPARRVVEADRPALFRLPAPGLSSRYIFATGTDFFAYPQEFNRYAAHYTDTFQHGGISMEEMMVPVAVMHARITE